MRFLIMACLGLAGMMVPIQAQSVAYYGFSEETGHEYVSLTGATEMQGVSAIQGEGMENYFFNATESTLYEGTDVSMTGIPIGFDFQFDGKTYDKFVAAGVGFLILGDASSTDVSITGNDRFTWPFIGITTDGSVYGVENTSIRYKLEGRCAMLPNQPV